MIQILRSGSRRIKIPYAKTYVRGFEQSLALGVGVQPFDALRLLWNLFSSWSICSAPVRGGMDDRWRLGSGFGSGFNRLMRLGFHGTCILSGLFALPLSGAGLTFFAAAKKVSKESSFPTPILARRLQTAPSEWSNRGSVVSGVSPLLACRKGAHVAPLYGVEQQSFIRLGTSCPTTGLPGGGEIEACSKHERRM
jgi:hypothetical protein